MVNKRLPAFSYAKLLYPPPECGPAHPELPGRLVVPPPGLDEGLHDHLFFKGLQRVFGAHDPFYDAPCLQVLGQVLWGYHPPLAADKGVLDDMLKLPYVARVIVIQEEFHSRRGDRSEGRRGGKAGRSRV